MYLFNSFTSYYSPLLLLSTSLVVTFIVYSYENKEITTIKNWQKRFARFSAKTVDFALMIKKITLPTNIVQYSSNKVQVFGADYLVYGLFCCFNYMIPYFMSDYYKIDTFSIALSFRVIAGFLCIGLLLREYWPVSFYRFFPVYWHFTLLFTLPFITFFMFFMSQWSVIWMINLALSIFLLILLTDWIMFSIILTLGSLLSVIIYSLIFGQIQLPSDVTTIYMTIYIIVFSVLIGLIFARRKERNSDDKIKVARLLGGTIAHEMRTFIMTIENYAYGLNRYLPKLIEGYQASTKNSLINDPIPSVQFEIIADSSSDIHMALKKASSFIDLLLVNIKEPAPIEINNINFSILACVQEAINSYPLTDQEKLFFHLVMKNNFNVKGSKELITHVLFNLTNNSLYYLFNKRNATIKIWTSSSKYYNYLHFYDNGQGIEKENLELIFKRFYIGSKKGTGLGLSFCKYAMKNLGGDIVCRSSKGEFTEFILTFPK